jgi:hypothetical protein
MRGDADEHLHSFPISSDRPRRPEELLAVAVLEDALWTLQRYAVADDPAARMLVAEVDRWFACNGTDHPFTFVSICDALALDVAYVRSGLRQWREIRRVALPTEPRVLHFTGPQRPEERVAPSGLRTTPGRSHVPHAGGSGRSALPPAPSPQAGASRMASRRSNRR